MAERASIDLVVTATSQDSAMSFARIALAELQKVDGVANAKLSVEEGNPEVHVALDRDKMASLGITMDVVGGTMQTAFSGTDQDSKLKFRQGEYEYDINLRYDNFNRKDPDDVRNIMFVNASGGTSGYRFEARDEGSGHAYLNAGISKLGGKVQSLAVVLRNVVKEFTERLNTSRSLPVSLCFGVC